MMAAQGSQLPPRSQLTLPSPVGGTPTLALRTCAVACITVAAYAVFKPRADSSALFIPASLAPTSSPSATLSPAVTSTPLPRRRLVVSRYNEDISWAAPYAADTIVYNKGPALSDPTPFKHVHASPNVGREAHAMLSYGIDHWDELPDFTVFAQGEPFHHLPQIFRSDAELWAALEGKAFTPHWARWQPGWRLASWAGQTLTEAAPGTTSLGTFWAHHFPDIPLPPDCGCYPAYFTSILAAPRSGAA
jgi:hypothetical protein